MKKLAYKWRLLLRRVLIVFSFGALAACSGRMTDEYGMPPAEYGMPSVSGSVRAADTKTPIPGIQVSIMDQQQTTTSEDGGFWLVTTASSGTLLFKDVDDAENGEFQDTAVPFNRSEPWMNHIGTIDLDRKQ